MANDYSSVEGGDNVCSAISPCSGQGIPPSLGWDRGKGSAQKNQTVKKTSRKSSFPYSNWVFLYNIYLINNGHSAMSNTIGPKLAEYNSYTNRPREASILSFIMFSKEI